MIHAGRLNDSRVFGLAGLLAPAAVFIGAVWAKHHFGPLNTICNTPAGQFAQTQDQRASLDCGGDTLAFELARIAFWASLVLGVLSVAMLFAELVGGPAAFGNLEQGSAAVAATAKVAKPALPPPPAQTTRRQLVRCATCNAPNDVDSTDTTCYQCGAPLQT